MSQRNLFKTFVAVFTAFTFFVTSLGINPNAFAAAAMPVSQSAGSRPEVSLPYQARLDSSLGFSIPSDLGRIESFTQGAGPTLIHIQTAHGHYEAQQQIRKILHHLDKHYGIKTLLVEGSAFELDSALINFFPKDRELTLKVANELTRHALLKGPELYLLDQMLYGVRSKEYGESAAKHNAVHRTPSALPAAAYGIEELKSYRDNGVAFVNVLEEKQKTQNFLADMNIQIERLSSHYLNKDLRDFLRRVEVFEKNQIPFDAWLTYLKEQSAKHLQMDLGDTGYQIDWPMMVRIFKIRELASKLDLQKFPKERKEFLHAISRWLQSTEYGVRSTAQDSRNTPYALRRTSFHAIESLLHSDSISVQLPDPETSLLFEDMVRQLPKDFNYDAFPNVRYFIGSLLLQSELKAPLLMKEIEKLTDKISSTLAKTEEEKTLVGLLKDYQLLQKLFALELLPQDYEAILARSTAYGVRGKNSADKNGSVKHSFKPSDLVIQMEQFGAEDRRTPSAFRRTKLVQFEHIKELDELFDSAMAFYAGVKDRDIKMEERIEERLKQTGAQKIVVITGGFHSRPFQDHFTNKDFSYALISPRLTSADKEGYEAYVQNTLQFTMKSTREDVYAGDPEVLRSENRYGLNQAAMRAEIRKVIAETVGRSEVQPNDKTVQPSKPHFPKGGKRYISLDEKTELKDKAVEAWRNGRQDAFYEDVDEALQSARAEMRGIARVMAIAVAAVLGFVASARAQIADVIFRNIDPQVGVGYELINTNPVPILAKKLTIKWFTQPGSTNDLAAQQVVSDMLLAANSAPGAQYAFQPAATSNQTQITVGAVLDQSVLDPTNNMTAAESSTNDWAYSAASGQDAPSGLWTTNGQVITYPAPTNKEEWAEFNSNLPTGGTTVSEVIVEVTIPTGMVVRVVGMANTGIIGTPVLVGTGQPQFVNFAISPDPTSPKGGEQYLQTIYFVRNPDGVTDDPFDGDLPGAIVINGIWRVMRSEARVTDGELVDQIAKDLRDNIELASHDFLLRAFQNLRSLESLEQDYYDVAQQIYQTLAEFGKRGQEAEDFFWQNHEAIRAALSRSEARTEEEERTLSVDVLLEKSPQKLPQDVIDRLKAKGFDKLGGILDAFAENLRERENKKLRKKENGKPREVEDKLSFLNWVEQHELGVALSRKAPISYAKIQKIRTTKSRAEAREGSEAALPFRQELLPKYLEYTPRKNRLSKENLKTLAIGDYIFLAPQDPNSIKIVTGFEDSGVFLAKVSPDGRASGTIKTSFKPSALMRSKFILASELPALNELIDQVGRSEMRNLAERDDPDYVAAREFFGRMYDNALVNLGVELFTLPTPDQKREALIAAFAAVGEKYGFSLATEILNAGSSTVDETKMANEIMASFPRSEMRQEFKVGLQESDKTLRILRNGVFQKDIDLTRKNAANQIAGYLQEIFKESRKSGRKATPGSHFYVEDGKINFEGNGIIFDAPVEIHDVERIQEWLNWLVLPTGRSETRTEEEEKSLSVDILLEGLLPDMKLSPDVIEQLKANGFQTLEDLLKVIDEGRQEKKSPFEYFPFLEGMTTVKLLVAVERAAPLSYAKLQKAPSPGTITQIRSEARAVLEKDEAMRLLDEKIVAAAGSEIAGYLKNAKDFLENTQKSLRGTDPAAEFFPQTWWGWKNVIGNRAAFESFASASGKYVSEKPYFKNYRDASDHLEKVERQCQGRLGEMKASLISDPKVWGIIEPILAKIRTDYPKAQPRPRTSPAATSSESFLRIITAMEETASLQLNPAMEKVRGSLNADQFRKLEEMVALELAGIRLQRSPFYTTRIHTEAGDWQLPLGLDEWLEFIGNPRADEFFSIFIEIEEGKKRVADSLNSWQTRKGHVPTRSEARNVEKQWLEDATDRFIRIVRDRGILNQMSPGDTSRAFANLFYGQFSYGMAQEIRLGRSPREIASRLIQPTHETIKGFLAFLPSSSWKEFLDYLNRLAIFIAEEKIASRETRSLILPWWNFADASLELQNSYPANTSREAFFAAYLEKYLAYHGYQATPAWSVAFTRSFLSPHKKHAFYDLNAQLGASELKRLAGEGSVVPMAVGTGEDLTGSSRSELRKKFTDKQIGKMAQTLSEYLDAPDLRESITEPRFRIITDPRSELELREITISAQEIAKVLKISTQELETVLRLLLDRMNMAIAKNPQQRNVPPFTVPEGFIKTKVLAGMRSEVRGKKEDQEIGIGATLSGFEPVEEELAQAERPQEVRSEQPAIIRSVKKIIRLFAFGTPDFRDLKNVSRGPKAASTAKRSEMRLDEASFAEGVAKIKAMYEYIMALTQGLTPEDVKVTFDHPYTEIVKVEGQPDQKIKKTVPVTLELFIPRSIEEVKRVIEIERNSWRTMNGVEIPEEEILERIFGDDAHGNPPDPIIVARVNGQIEGGIYMSFESLAKFPETYKGAQHTLSPKDSDDVVDFSVFTERATSAYQLFPVLARSTVAFAQMYGIDKVVPYSRSEPFSRHIANNPRFQGPEYRNKKGTVDAEKVFAEFARFVTKRGHSIEQGISFEDYRKFFRIDVGSMDPAEVKQILEKVWKELDERAKKKNPQGSGPTIEQIKKYLTISGFDGFEDYAAFHITQVGDPFLSSTHLALGAKFVRYIPHSRLEDLRAMQGNAIVVYDAPVLPEADRKINLLGKPISVRAETRTVIGVEELKAKIERLRQITARRSLSVIDALTRQKLQEEIQALTEEDFKNLSVEDIKALIDWQIEALVDWQIELLTHEQRDWLDERLNALSAALPGKGPSTRSEARQKIQALENSVLAERGARDREEIEALAAKVAEFKTSSRGVTSPEMWRILHLTRNGAQAAKKAQDEMQMLTKRGVQDLGKDVILGLTPWHIQALQDWHIRAMTSEQRGWLSSRLDELSAGQSEQIINQYRFHRSELRKQAAEELRKLAIAQNTLRNQIWQVKSQREALKYRLEQLRKANPINEAIAQDLAQSLKDATAQLEQLRENEQEIRNAILELTNGGSVREFSQQARMGAFTSYDPWMNFETPGQEMYHDRELGGADIVRDRDMLGAVQWGGVRYDLAVPDFIGNDTALAELASGHLNRSEVRQLGKTFMEGFLGGVALLAMTAFMVDVGLAWLTDIPMTVFEWAGFLSVGVLLCVLGSGVRTAYIWWTTPFNIPALLEARRIGLVVDNLIRFSAERERMKLSENLMNAVPAAVDEMPETSNQASYAVREIPNALFQGALFFGRSEVRGLVKTFAETFFKGAVLFTFAAFVIYVGDRVNENPYLTAVNWKTFIAAGIFLSGSVAALKTFFVRWHTRSEQLKHYRAIAKGIMSESERKFQEETGLGQRSEARQLDRGKVADIERNLWRQGFPPELLREQGESILNKSEKTVSGILRGHFSKAYTNTWRDYNKILEEAGIDTVSESAKKENLEAFAKFIISIAGRMEQTIIQAAGRLLKDLKRREVERLGSVYLRGGVIWLQLLFWNKVGAAKALEDIFREMGFYERNAWSFFLGERLNKVAAGNFLIEVAEIRPVSQAVPQPVLTPALRSEARTIRVPIQSAKPGDSIMGFVRSTVKPKDLAGREVVVILKNHEIDAAGNSFEALALSLKALKVSKMSEASGIELRSLPLTPFSRSETRTASEIVKKVADALSQEEAEWASFVLTSLKESKSFMGLPAWIAAAIDRGLIATSVELDSAGWYKNNRTQLINELDSRSAIGEQAKTNANRSENRELSDESAPSVESQKTKSHRHLLISAGKEAVLAHFNKLMDNGETDEASSLSTSMELLSFTPEEDEVIVSDAQWVVDQIRALQNSHLHSLGSIIPRSETRETPEQTSSQGSRSIPDDKWLKTDKMLENTRVTILAGYGDRIFDRYQELVQNGHYDAAARIYSDLESLLANPHGDQVLVAGVQKVIDRVHAFEASRRGRSGIVTSAAPKDTGNRSEARVAVAESVLIDSQVTFAATQAAQEITWELRELLKQFYFGIIPFRVHQKIMALGNRINVAFARLLGVNAYAEDVNMPVREEEKLTLVSEPKSFKDFPRFGVATGVLFSLASGKIADGLIFSRKFAFGRGAIAAARTVLGDIPIALVGTEMSAKELQFITDLNLQLQKSNRPEIFIAKTPEEALRHLRANGATRLKVLFDGSETKTDLLAVALKNQISDMQFVNDEEFRSFLGYAGDGIKALVQQVQADFAILRAA